jgi:hypothetical protein
MKADNELGLNNGSTASQCISLRFIIQINNETISKRKVCEFYISLALPRNE